MLEKFSFFEKVNLLTSVVLFSKATPFYLNLWAFLFLCAFSHVEQVKNFRFPIQGMEATFDEVLQACYLSSIAESLTKKGLLQAFLASYNEKGELNENI